MVNNAIYVNVESKEAENMFKARGYKVKKYSRHGKDRLYAFVQAKDAVSADFWNKDIDNARCREEYAYSKYYSNVLEVDDGSETRCTGEEVKNPNRRKAVTNSLSEDMTDVTAIRIFINNLTDSLGFTETEKFILWGEANGYTERDMAEMLNKPQSSIHSKKKALYKKLRDEIEKK